MGAEGGYDGDPGPWVVYFGPGLKVWEPGAPVSEGRRRETASLTNGLCPSSGFLFCLGSHGIG